MHYQLFQSAVCLAFALPTVLGTTADPSLDRRQSEWPTTTKDIDISLLSDFTLESQNSDPKELVTRESELNKRSLTSALVCRRRTPLPSSGGKWLHKEATCDRTGTETDVNTFKVTCMAENLHADLNYRNPGACAPDQLCVEFHGYNEIGQGAWDVTCVDKPDTHTWDIDTNSSPGRLSSCSAGWNNNGNRNVKATFEVDVMDSGSLNRISPKEVYYQLNGKRIGVSRGGDPDVGSGAVVIPPGGSLQACVTASQGQVLNILGAITSILRI